jgi:hypothetical protein
MACKHSQKSRQRQLKRIKTISNKKTSWKRKAHTAVVGLARFSRFYIYTAIVRHLILGIWKRERKKRSLLLTRHGISSLVVVYFWRPPDGRRVRSGMALYVAGSAGLLFKTKCVL